MKNTEQRPKEYYFAIYSCKVENVVTRIFENDIDIQKVEFHGFIRMITRKELSNDLVEKIEGRAIDYAYEVSNCDSACCAIKIITYPHLNYDFRSSDECLFKQPCSCGTSVLLNRIKSNYNYFRDKVGRENYRNASEIDLDEEEEG